MYAVVLYPLIIPKTGVFLKGSFSQKSMRCRLWKMSIKSPQNEEKRDIRPRCCTAPSRFLAINKNGGEREELSKPSTDDGSYYSTPPALEQDSNVPKSHLQFVHNCTIRQFQTRFSSRTDNLYKFCTVFSLNARRFRRFYSEIRKITLQIAVFMVI